MLGDVVSALGGLSLPARLGVTVLLVCAAVAAVSGGRHLQRRVETPSLRPLVTVLVIGLVCGLGAVFVSVWSAWDELARATASLPVERRLPEVAVTVPLLLAAHVVSTLTRDTVGELFEGREAVTAHQQQTTARLAQLFIWTTTLIVVLGVWEIDLRGLLIGAGFLGIVVGMAARQTLGNVLAGLVLLFTRPFAIGDWVAIGSDEGVVTDITIVSTHLRTLYGEDVVVPNDLVQDTHVVNRSRRGRLLVEVDVGVAYGTDLDHAVETSLDAVSGLDELIDAPGPEVTRKRFADSAIVLGVRGWIDSPTASRREQAQSAMIDAIAAAYEREDITIPFPQRTVTTQSASEHPAHVLGGGARQPPARSVEAESGQSSRGDGE
jgi:small-conductance mechanosensitive channel